jgi:hypothetical protein
VIRVSRLICDNAECQRWFDGADRDADQVRALAAELGWIRLNERFDLCQACAPGWTPDV